MSLKLNSRGFAAVQATLIVIILAIVGGTGYFVYNANKKTGDTLDAASKVVQSSTSKTTKKKALADPTAKWTTFTSVKGKFTTKYPATWVQPTHRDLCAPELLDNGLYLGPNAQAVLVCASENGGQMGIFSQSGDKRADFTVKESDGYKNIVTKEVTVSGVTGQRVAAVAISQSDQPFALPEGTISVSYTFYVNGNTYHAYYRQTPSAPDQDVLSDFDLMITKTLKFN